MLVQLRFITAFVAAMTLRPTDDPEWIETRVLPRVDASAAIDVGRRTWKPLPENTLAGSTLVVQNRMSAAKSASLGGRILTLGSSRQSGRWKGLRKSV